MDQSIRPIQKLSSDVIGQIAAGEVVERPASVVKELVENSIDAGATSITVELREGGIQYLRVSDNGQGIPAGQIRMAFERHATSKIIRSQDLFDVHTLGFRGEALASIAAVSKVTCTTRTAQEDFGVRTQVEGGQIVDVREAATPVGTTLLVKDLFYNTPVRLKFLKKPSLEASLVTDYMTRLILSRPDIAFRYVNEGKTIYQSVGDGSVEAALLCCYGKESLQAMHRVQGNQNGVLVEGYVGVGSLARGNRQQQSFFVNGRYFRNENLSKALEAACQGLVMIGRFPSCALYLQLAYDKVDVNVHPNKLEVRFQGPAAVANAVEELTREAVQETRLGDVLAGNARQEGLESLDQPEEGIRLVMLEGATGQGDETGVGKPVQEEEQQGVVLRPLRPAVIPAKPTSTVLKESYAFAYRAPMPTVLPSATVSWPGEKPVTAEPAKVEIPTELQQETLLPEELQPTLRLLGIAFQTYLLFETGERLLWVDQHAAHERILYDKFWKRYEDERISQRLLTPQLVQVTAQELALLTEWQPMLEEAGFDVQPFDDTSVAVHAIPTLFGENEPAGELLMEAIDAWQAGRGPVTQERMRRQVAQMACKRAIKGGDKLSDMEVNHLLQTMLETGILPTCPHGRPIAVEVTRRDLEKRFKRIQ